MRPQDIRSINIARAERRTVLTMTDLDTGASTVIREGQTLAASHHAHAAAAFRTGKSGLATIDERPVFINVYLPVPRIVIIGAVHIAQALAPMAATTDFDVTIIDPRTAFATPERFAGTRLIAEWPEDGLKLAPLDAYTALVALAHDPKIDDVPLQAALEAGCFYVGALGSRKSHASRVERLRALGLDDDAIGRIHAPIGLDIHASSPAEIAVAILGDIIQSLRTRDVMSGAATIATGHA